MATRMQQRRGTAAQWTAANPILAAGEIGFETDTGQFKIGDGVNTWSSLGVFKDFGDLDTNGFVLDSEKANPNGVATLDGTGRIPMAQLGNLIANAPGALDTLIEIADAITAGDSALTSHNLDQTNVHGIADTAQLALLSDVSGAITTEVTNRNSEIDTRIGTHNSDTTDVHGIANTALLETTAGAQSKADAAALAEVNTHNADTTGVHGIADTAALATKVYADGAVTVALSSVAADLSGHNSTTANVHGIADTSALATKSYADGAVNAHNLATNAHGVADLTALATTAYVDTADNLKAALASPSFTGTPTAPTAAAGTNTTQIATTEFVGSAVAALVASSPAALDTLNELATALGSDANFATTMTNALALKASLTDLSSATLSSFNNKTTSYTLVLSDEGNMVEMDSSSANTVTIPPASSVAFNVGSAIDVFQKGTGQTTIVAGAGVTILNTPGLKFRARYSVASLIKRDANTWIVTGDLTA